MAEGSVRDRAQVVAPPASPIKEKVPCPVCELCGSFEGLRICAACRDAWYCSKEHQKSDWSKHKTHCKSKKVAPSKANPKEITEAENKTPASTSDSDQTIKDKASTSPTSLTSETDAPQSPAESDSSKQTLAEEPKISGSAPDSSVKDTASTPDPAVGPASSEKSAESSLAVCDTEKVDMTKSSQVLDSKNPNSPGNGGSSASKGKLKSAKRKHKAERRRAEEMAQSTTPPHTQTLPEPDSDTKSLADYVVKCLSEYGICVVDRFLGESKGNLILEEVMALHGKGIFQDGQLISGTGPRQTIRGDQITWVERGESGKEEISYLIGRLDTLLMACNERFRRIDLGGRTKAMVACYPGSGTYYLRHVDNPNEDGRLITCIYYLNKDWDSKKDGGVLRIFPESVKNSWVADIEPKFDRLLFFWSDRRNPHEVQAAYKQRFAITVWYFDKAERQRALSRYQSSDVNQGNARTMSTTLVSPGSTRQ